MRLVGVCAIWLPLVFGRIVENYKMHQKDDPGQCGYKACNPGVPGMLNVHLVPHSHDDPGWLITADQYYYTSIQYILDTLVAELWNDPSRRFGFVEVSEFKRWWYEQDDEVQHMARTLISEWRLQFIMGGWCQNDEAAAHYTAIIDQHSLGFQFLRMTFGECALPRVGWQIDPFGHSKGQASLFAQFGYDAMFIGRLDYQDKEKRMKDKTAEFVWFASDSLGDQTALFASINYNGYSAPNGFCFDANCNDPPIQDDQLLHDYNVDERVTSFLNIMKDQAQHYTTDHLMVLMGSDYQYTNAHMNYKNMDKLIKYVNLQQSNGSNVNMFYSTSNCYMYAVNTKNLTYTSKQDDFFPYASRGHTFWTGYYTSRPALKEYIRTSNRFLQVCKQLDVLALLETENWSYIKMEALKEAVAVNQHHDAVGGTEKQAVAYDYAMRLAHGIQECQDVVNSAYRNLLCKHIGEEAPLQQFCPLLNVSYCNATENNDKFTVVVYNPRGSPGNSWLRLPVTGSQYHVETEDGTPVPAQIVPVSHETMAIPGHNGSRAVNELIFNAVTPPLGFQTYFVQKTSEISRTSKVLSGDNLNLNEDGDLPLVAYNAEISRISKGACGECLNDNDLPMQSDITIKNEYLQLTFDQKTGLLKQVVNLKKSISLSVQQMLMYYKSFVGDNHNEASQASGAYIFRPNGTAQPIGTSVKTKLVQGSLVQEFHQIYDDWASQVYRLYTGEQRVEIEWTVGPIPFKDGIGKEVISRFITNINNNKTYFTDSNGREVLKRVRDYRPTWDLNQTEPIAGNYYPIPSRIYIQDSTKAVQLTVLTDRSQGGGSIWDGELEIMVHRRVLHDDNFGVQEPLNETGISGKGLVARGKHYLFVDNMKSSVTLHREFAMKLFSGSQVSFAPLTMSLDLYTNRYNTMWSGLRNTTLPPNVHLLTLQRWTYDTYMLRLEHFYEKDEDPVMSMPARVSIKDLFGPFNITSAEEMTLGGNQYLKDAKRLQWNVKGYGTTKSDIASFVTPLDSSLTVELKPMQIRTFRIIMSPAA